MYVRLGWGRLVRPQRSRKDSIGSQTLASEARLRIATIGDQISDPIQDHQPMYPAVLRIVDSAATCVARELAMLAASMPGS